MTPLTYENKGDTAILTAEITGTFPGSLAVLHYHFEIKSGLIQSLKITG